MRRKVFVAMALASKAEVIFLDEPTTGLDPISRMEVWSAIKKLKSYHSHNHPLHGGGEGAIG